MSSDVNDFVIKQHTKLLTRGANGGSVSPILPSIKFEEAIASGDEAFETMHDLTVYHSHNEISFYTWGDSQCCLPEGAISATVRNDGNKLDDLLLFTWNSIVSSSPEHVDLENLKTFLREEIGLQWIVPDNPEITPTLVSENLDDCQMIRIFFISYWTIKKVK